MEGGSVNWFAYVAILTWPVVAFAAYSWRSSAEATAWTILGALLFLPTQAALKIQMVPAIDKGSVASLASLVGSLLFSRKEKMEASIGFVIPFLGTIYLLSPVITSFLNADPIVAGPRVIAGVDYYDGVSALLSQAIQFLPFFIGLRYFARREDTEVLLRVLVLAAVIYSPFLVFEIRFSPQLANWIYGVVTPFAVEMRYGGFRPVAFMINGLAAAFFLATATIACVSLWRLDRTIWRLPSSGLTAYLGGILILCKSAGALLYAIVLGMVSRWMSPRRQMSLAVVLALVAILYPLLRINNLVPTDQVLELAASFNPERASSLKFRFVQEDQLLAHATERFWFGWGRYGRNRVYDDLGGDISVTDGQWILTFGQFGFIGFVAQFGLLTWAIFQARRVTRLSEGENEAIPLTCLSLIVAITAVEQIPNASLSPWSWLLAGALLSRCIAISSQLAGIRSSTRRRSATRGTSKMQQFAG